MHMSNGYNIATAVKPGRTLVKQARKDSKETIKTTFFKVISPTLKCEPTNYHNPLKLIP